MSHPDEDGLLDSWKRIADYLKCDERTARRWEKDRGLPIYRVPGRGRRAVFAYRSEIDAWLRNANPGSGPPFSQQVTSSGHGEQSAALQPAPRETVRDNGMPWRSVRRAAFVILLMAAIASLTAAMRNRGKASISDPPAAKKSVVESNSASRWRPEVLSVQFGGKQNDLILNLSGLGFGRAPFHLPFTGDVPWFRIGDVSCFAVAPGTCESGYTGDSLHLKYLSWSNCQIVFSHFKPMAPGDAIELAAWNPQVAGRQGVAVWGGNIPPIRPGTPRISTVTFSGSGKHLHITIRGANFGPRPAILPHAGNTEFLEFGDYAYHNPGVPQSTYFRAGYQNSSFVCSITLAYASWSNTKIEIDGFAGSYGQNGMVVRRGDPVSIDLWNTKNLLATAWGGRIQ